MAIKWKNSRKLNPDVILDKIDSIKIVQDDGRVSYSGFKYLGKVGDVYDYMRLFKKGIKTWTSRSSPGRPARPLK